MRTYCYVNKNGKKKSIQAPVGKAPRTIRIEGYVARRDFQAEGVSVPATAGWPLECVASGVHPEQAGELRREFEKCGVETEVSRNGNPIYRNASHRRKALKARGFVDKSSFC